MSEQVSLLDIVKSKNDRHTLTPEVWSCIKTCKNFTNVLPQGGRDYFPGTKEPRCTYAYHRSFGTSGQEWESKIINNVWHTWCVLYQPKNDI